MGRGRIIAGLVIVLIGVGLMLDTLNIGHFDFGTIFGDYFWPVVLILIGVSFLTDTRSLSASRLVVSGVFILAGLGVLADHLGLFYFHIGDLWSLFWPVVLILIGINLLSRNRGRQNWAVMGNVNKRHENWKVENGDYWAIMGSVHIDLRTADIPDGETVIRTTAVMGEATILVPEGLAVICRGNSVLGSLNFFGRHQGGLIASHEYEFGDVAQSTKVVRIVCDSIMGNVKVMAR